MLRKLVSLTLLSVGLSSFMLGCSAATVKQTTAQLPHVMTCAGKPAHEPSSFTISCADANTYLKSLHWTKWTALRATATGTFWANDCTPYCAAGKFHSYRATVTLSDPKSTAHHGRLFGEISVTYVSGHTTKHLDQSLPLAPLSGAAN